MPQKINISPPKRHRIHLGHLHAWRVLLFAGLGVSLLVIQFASDTQRIESHRESEQHVLAYATNVSRSGLLSATNKARAANGKGALRLNSKLNSSAQSKGNDMIAKNYWAHNSPSGTTPWDFFAAAGYRFTRAGENLAYGFDGSKQINDAWMNSSGHRANVLGDYKDVGFGIANGSHYQGGQYTVVVAHYGKPVVSYVAPPPTKSTTKTTTTKTPAKTTIKKTTKPKPAPAKPKPTTKPTPATPVVSAPETTKKVSNLEALLGGQASWAVYASLGLMGVTTLGFGLTHWRLVRHGWQDSKHFILVHPALDLAVITVITIMVLGSASGFIG